LSARGSAFRLPITLPAWHKQASFDVTTGVDLQEVDNAVNQAQKEISQRYDFKGSPATIELNRTEGKIALTAENDYKDAGALGCPSDQTHKRGVSVKNLDPGEIKPAGGDTVRRDIALKLALDGDTAKKVAAAIKEAKLKKVQAAIQAIRCASPPRRGTISRKPWRSFAGRTSVSSSSSGTTVDAAPARLRVRAIE